jgi:hypothetical protein
MRKIGKIGVEAGFSGNRHVNLVRADLSVFAFAALKLRRTRFARKGEAWWARQGLNL